MELGGTRGRGARKRRRSEEEVERGGKVARKGSQKPSPASAYGTRWSSALACGRQDAPSRSRDSSPPMDELESCWLSIAPWGQLALVLACGRVLLALLPPGHVGSHRWSLLPVTLAASMVLGAVARGLSAGADGGAQAWIAAGILAVGALAWAAGPRAFVPQREPPPIARTPLEAAAHVAVLAAGFAPALWSEEPFLQSMGGRDGFFLFVLVLPLLVTSELVLHALSIADRRALGAAAVVIVLVTLPAMASIDAMHGKGSFAALAAGSLIAWSRRADRRSRSLVSIGYAALAAVSPPAAVAGFASALRSVHRHARKGFAREAALAAVAIALPMAWVHSATATPAESRPWPAVRELGFPDAALAIGVLLALAVLAGWRGRAGSASREARAVAAFVSLAVALHGLAASTPWGDVLGARSWGGIRTVVLPAVALLAGLVLVPARADATANGPS